VVVESGAVFRFRVEPDIRRLLNRLRDERDVNISAWIRRQVREALHREFPEEVQQPAPEPGQPPPCGGWKPCRVGQGWGSMLDGPDVEQLPQDLTGTRITVTDSRGASWNATIEEVVSRSNSRIVVRDSGRPAAS